VDLREGGTMLDLKKKKKKSSLIWQELIATR
jgi:hypothetical protein